MKIVFVSNYLNHHQIPFCMALCEEEDIDFNFIQIYEMEESRVNMGWGVSLSDYPFAISFIKETGRCKKLILDADLVIFGGVDDEEYIKPRLTTGKPVVRYSERIYKEGQWKFISPKGLIKKYNDHIKYRKDKVYLLCAGGYVASDFSLIHAYKDKMFTWGYFPKVVEYTDLDELRRENDKVELLWTGRMIDWKHPEAVVKAAKRLKEAEIDFHFTVIGEGNLRTSIEKMAINEKVYNYMTFLNFVNPEENRKFMRKADIYLFSSDYKEGWGAVLNESMNSGCAVVASSGIGAVPYLLKHEYNGLVYKTGDDSEMTEYVLRLCKDSKLRKKLSENAYETMINTWTPEIAAKRFAAFAKSIESGKLLIENEGPLSRADIISPAYGYKYVRQ